MAEPVAATQSAGQGFVGISVENSTATVSHGFNISLLKSATFLQAAVGFLITTSVVAATVFAFVVFGITVSPDTPIAPVIEREMFKGTKLTIDAVAECKDKRNANLTLVDAGPATYGHVITRAGKIVFDLSKSPSYAGYDYFNYTVSNDQFQVTSYIKVYIKNHAPEAVPLKYTILKNSKNNKAFIFDKDSVGLNGLRISDIDSDELKIVNVTTPAHGSADFTEQYIIYTPDFQFNGLDFFNYTISDNNDTSSETIYFQIENTAPKAKEDFYSEPKNQILILDVLENDIDPNFDELNITSVDRVQKGGVRIDEAQKHVIYTPIRTKKTYSDSFEYTITDGVLTSSTYVILEIRNRAPVAEDIKVSVFKNSKAGVSFPLKFSDPDTLETVSLVGIDTPSKGSVNYTTQTTSKQDSFLNDLWIVYDWFDYDVTYTPTPGKTGIDSFTYAVTDSADEGKATITVEIINQAPVATNQTASLNKRESVDVKVSACTDENEDTCLLQRVVSPTRNGGTVVKVDDDTLRYTAPQTGQATSDVIEFILVDKQDDVAAQLEAHGHVDVSIINQPPVAKAVTATAHKGIAIDIQLDGSDPTDDALFFDSFAYNADYKQTNISVNIGAGTGKVADSVHFGTLRQSYTDVILFYVKDEQGKRSEQPATITVTVVNDKPVAVDDAITTHWRTPVKADLVANDNDPNPGDKEKLTISRIGTQPTKGTVVFSGKSVTYTPKGEQAGTDTFTYYVTDGETDGESVEPAVVTVTLTNDAPTPSNDAYTKHHRVNPVLLEVIANDTDPNSDPISMVSFTTVATPHGSATLIPNQNGKSFISYSSNTNFVGTDSFTYAVTDGDLQGTATVTVVSTNTKPVANPDSFEIHWNSKTKTANVLANDVDPDNDPLALKTNSLVPSAGFKGTVSITDAAAGTVTFSTSNDFKGQQSVDYVVTDGPSETTGTLSITVTNYDVPKVLTPITRRVQWRALQAQALQITALSQTTDSDGDTLTLSVEEGPVTKVSAGVLQYAYTGVKTDTFKYRISDGLDYAVSTGSVEVFNTVPTCQNVANFVVVAGSSRTIDVVATSNDVDGDPLTLDANPTTTGSRDVAPVVSKTAQGTLSIEGVGVGTFTVSFTVSDSIASSATCTVELTVASVEDKQYDVHWSKHSTGQALDVLTGINVPTPIILTDASGAQHGTTVVQGSNVLYKPTKDFIGGDRFTASYTYGSQNTPATVNVVITVYDNAPSAQPKSASMHWLKLRTPGAIVNLLAGASDPDGSLDTVTYNDKSSAAKGSVNVASGVATYTATATNPAYLGDDTFTYTVTDGLKVSTPAVVTITSTNTKPTTVSKTRQVLWREHTAGKTIDVLTGDAPGDDGETLTLVSVTKPAEIESAVKNGNQVTVKGANMAGKRYSLPYVVTDGAESVPGSVTVEVTNTVPTCTPFSNSYHWRTAQAGIAFTPTEQCADNDNDPLTFVTPLSIPANAGATLTASGNTVTYKPRANSLASDSFTIQVTDGPSTTPKTYSLSFTNTAPVASNVQGAETHWRSSVALNAVCTDANNDPITFTRTSGPSAGTLTNFNSANGVATYKPNADIAFSAGTGKRTTTDSYKFKCSDVVSESSEATATVTIFNNAPTAPAQTYTFARDFNANPVRNLGVFAHANKPSDADTADSTALAVVSTGQAAQIVSIKAGGQSLDYTFTQAYKGSETFTYTVSDGNIRTTGQITVSITNSAPSCTNIVQTVPKGRTSGPYTLKTQCTDANNDPVTFSVQNVNCGKGTIALVKDSAGNDAVTYTPNARRSGTDQCTITASDGIDSSTFLLQVSITNNAPNTVPVKTFTYRKLASYPTPYTFTVLDGTSDPDGDVLALQSFADVSSCFQTKGGVLNKVGNTITYTPSTSFVGTCSFTYTYTDQDQDQPKTATGTVSVSIYNDPPVAVNDAFTVKQSETFTRNVADLLANDYDVNGDPISFVSITCKPNDPTYCKRTPTVTSGVITIPTAGKTCSTVIFDYTIQTPDGLQATATVTVQDVECKCFKAVDLGFVLDGSGSVGTANWQKSKDFVNAIVSKFNIGNGADQSRVAVIQFGYSASYSWDSQTYCYTYQTWWGSWTDSCSSKSKLGIPFTSDPNVATSRIGSLTWLNEGTFTHVGLRTARDYMTSSGRPGVDKVMIVFTDGAANIPCDCGECQKMPGFGSENACKNSYWPGQTCSSCSWDPNKGKWCMPCAEPRVLADEINATPGWRIVSVGVGDGLPPVGWAQVQGLAYNKNTAAFKIDWNSLDSIYNAIVQSSCYA